MATCAAALTCPWQESGSNTDNTD